MDAVFKAWKTSRAAYLKFFENYSLEQLNIVPEGFNNNLIWNIGHIIATHHKLIYIGSSLKGHIPEDIFNKYQSGTRPTSPVSQAEADLLKDLLISQMEPTVNDFQNNIFVTYKERTTGTGFHVTTIREAFEWNNFHEGLHLGYMMSMRKLI
ncbi:DinB family protein [uncultured Chryseobacterium sp.]|uniref:DinB family protein n=1 Tax=uncultured Chryseobacterium sp. TaxID=259322 RepID=UPI00258E87F3|nr:DinB family protein [uncultured Chryseobacterium sp.]